MIKNKEATDSAALEFCHILNKFAAQLDECLSFKDFGLRQNSRASFRRKLGESAICSKYEQNSTASLSVAYLFFIIYSKSTVGQLTKLKFLWKLCQYDRYKHQPTPYQFSLAQILMQNQKSSDHRSHRFQTKDQRCYRRIHILLPHDL